MEQTNRDNLLTCYTELNQLALEMGGFINLSKNCFVEPIILEQMYAPALIEFKQLKDQYDPNGILMSDVFEQYFPSYFGEGMAST
jgi:FAD/FMN-containing dehydrogenase